VNTVVVNRTTTVNVTNINVYNNVHVNNAVSGVAENRFGRGAIQTTRVSDAQVKELSPVRGPLQVKPAAASVMSADRATLTPPAAVQNRTVVATRAPRDFSSSLRAEGLGAERAAPAAASPRIVPAPKRTVAVSPPEGQSSSQRPPRTGDTPNARRPDQGAGPNTPPPAPRSGARGGAAGQPNSRQPQQPATDEGDAGRKVGPPPPPPHNTAGRPHGGAADKGRRPEARHGQQQRSGDRPPEGKDKPAEK
jgi:hypothetical protein